MLPKENAKSQSGNESSDDNIRKGSVQQEQEQKQNIDYPPALEPFQETIVLGKPLGIRINKTTMKVTFVGGYGAIGRVSVGDVIVSVDGHKITTIDVLNSILRKPNPTVAVCFKRAYYSRCKNKGTFVERISVERDREMKCTGRAIDLFLVQMVVQISDIVDINEMLGLSVKYDAKERIQVTATAANSLSSVHLRPGDIIREVNEYPIASKTMLDHFIQSGIAENGQINFTIESSASGSEECRDNVDLASDVIDIAQKQIALYRTALKNKTLHPTPVLRKQHSVQCNRKIIISDKITEIPIIADYDPSKLKQCRSASKETFSSSMKS